MKSKQIEGGKITENLGFKSLLLKVKNFFVLLLFFFQILHKNCISLFLTMFEYRTRAIIARGLHTF